MVKVHEDAYWPDNLSLFTISCENYWEPKKQIMKKSGIHSFVPCLESTLEQFLFYRVSGKMTKSNIFWSPSYSTINLSKQYFSHKIEAPRNIIFQKILDTQENKFFWKVLSRHGTELWMPNFLIILFYWPLVMLTTDSEKWQIVRAMCVLMKFDHMSICMYVCMYVCTCIYICEFSIQRVAHAKNK